MPRSHPVCRLPVVGAGPVRPNVDTRRTNMKRDHKQFPKDDNGDVLWELRCEGDALTDPREIDFTVIFPSKKVANEFAATCRKKFKVELQEAEEAQEDGLNWEVIVYTHAVPTHSGITLLEETLGKQAAPLGGRRSGWSSVCVPSAPPVIAERWSSYLASYDGLLGSIRLNFGLKDHAPISGLTTLLITGVSYESGREKPEMKMPETEDLAFLNDVSEKRVALVTSRWTAIHVGAFLHDNMQVDYFYIADPDGLEAALKEFHEKECPGRRQSFKTQSEPDWGAYLLFLYPNEATIEHYREKFEREGVI